MANETFALSVEQVTLAGRIVDFAATQNEQLKAIVRELFTPDVLANKAFYNAARNAMETHAVKARDMAPASARTFVYRLLQRAEIEAPGKNAGANNGNAAASNAKEAEAAAVVAQGKAAFLKRLAERADAAWEAELGKGDWSAVRKLIDAAQDARKPQPKQEAA